MSDDRFRQVVERSADAFLLYDGDGRLLDVNRAACRIYGYERADLLGRPLAELLADGATGEALISAPLPEAGEEAEAVEGIHRTAGGRTFEAEIRVGALGEDRFALVRDVSERSRHERQLTEVADQDGLTGLPNCPTFLRHVELAVQRAATRGLGLAILHVDLNRFRLINQGLGSEAGDELLRQAAWRLREVAGPGDLVARYSADEFLLLLPDLDRPNPEVTGAVDGPVEAAERAAARVHEALEPPFAIEGTELYVDAAVGISLYPYDADDAKVLMRNADAAARQAKAPGEGPTKRFAGDTSDKWARLWLATRLRKAVEREQLVLHYQPIVDLGSLWAAREAGEDRGLARHLAAVEALVRWQDGDGLVPPGSFIPLAEDLGLIEAIGRWVFSEVCRQSVEWRAAGRPLGVSFNLSLRELWRPTIVEDIVSRMAANDLDPGTLIVEVTETSAMTDPVRTRAVLRALGDHGLRLAIDDFGAGHSSLARLNQLPAELLKLDRSFVARLPDDPSAAAMVTAMIELARNLGMTALAEGIETEEQLAFLAERGCPLGQGFLFSRPVPAAELLTL